MALSDVTATRKDYSDERCGILQRCGGCLARDLELPKLFYVLVNDYFCFTSESLTYHAAATANSQRLLWGWDKRRDHAYRSTGEPLASTPPVEIASPLHGATFLVS